MNKSLRAPIAPVDLTENRLFQKYYVTGSIKGDVCMQIGEIGRKTPKRKHRLQI